MDSQKIYDTLIASLNENDLDPANLRRVMLMIGKACSGKVTAMQLILACLLLARETDPKNFAKNVMMTELYKRVDDDE